MKKVKDFLYNWNDLVIILCILAIAAGLIYWRVTKIMDYPRYIAAQAQERALAEKEAAESLTPVDPNADSSSTSSTETSDTSSEPKPGSGPRNGKLWSGGMLREEVSVTTASGSAAEAVESLVEAGLFTSYEDFEVVCELNGFDPTDIKANDFTFSPGTTQAQIAEEVTKPMS